MIEDFNTWSKANQKFLTNGIQLINEQIECLYNADDHAPKPDFHEQFQQLINEHKSFQPMLPFIRLSDKLKLSDFEQAVILLAAAPEFDSEFGKAAGKNGLSVQPTFSLAFSIFPNQHWDAITPDAPLRYWQLIRINRADTLANSLITINEQILHYLTGVKSINEKLKKIFEPVQVDEKLVPSQYELAELILNTCLQSEVNKQPYIFFLGNQQTDKLKIAAHISAQKALSLYTLSIYSIPNDVAEISELTLLWNREASLNNYALFLDTVDLDMNDKSKVQSVIYFIKNVDGLLIISSNQWVPETGKKLFAFDVQKPITNEQLILWKQRLGKKINQQSLSGLVSQFSMSTATIDKACNELNTVIGERKTSSKKTNLDNDLWKICCRLTRPQLGGLAQRIESPTGWDDLVLPALQKEILKEIAIHVRQRHKVYGTWGFEKKEARGLGITVLFVGESGTGKTMAAEVLANELHLDLYRIDLSNVINKYIGETEKNLKKIFDAAENGGAILLFDEADALFGKRSDVKDSHDRYSNIEVSYLLQRMEAYRGLAILTTNMKNALDKAFMRRIRFVVQFPFPDLAQRAEIWTKIFPANTPKEGLNMEQLAKLNLSGGNIRNIALNAAFLAAEEEKPVQMSHISQAAKSECIKLERPFSSLEFR
ncbi:MAG: ATP-binding protein [Flavisolibacter sp.]